MAATAFDTLDAARRPKAAGIDAEHAEAIVGVMGRSVSQLVTAEHFDAEIAKLHAGNIELHARVDSVKAVLQTAIMRSHLISVGVLIAAMALAMTILGIIITHGAGV